MINAIIVDDEPLALDVLETYLEKIPDIELVARCSNALEANDVLKKEKVDLMFLDIQMPQLTGIDFVKTLSNPPQVIFTTAYANYALEGFELNAIDYLVKPISLERFMKAVNKAVDQIELKRGSVQAKASGAADHDEKEDFIFVKADKKLVKIKYDDIIYIEGLKDYVIIRMDTQRVITLQTMKSLEDKLPSDLFRRIHRSYIVAVDKIDAVIGNMVEVKEKGQAKHLPIGKNYRDELLEIVNKNRL
jgi:DNA-binding LytR/AlgR family response regulator